MTKRLRRLAPLGAAFAVAAALAAFGSAAPRAATEDPPPYTVVDGKVDGGTFNGYRRYGNSCLQCHGPDGLGSSYAPSLVESLKHLSREDFNNTVVNGRINQAAGQQNVMPSFAHVEDVMLYLDDIYGYLKARSDGALGRGRPQRIPNAG